MTDPTHRFSGCAENYVRFRPGYPVALIALLQRDCGFSDRSVVADIGSGTGILSGMLLKLGNRVIGIEPNRDMRLAAERLLVDFPGFVSVEAKAESTTLPDGSVDLIVAAQSFHWFDREQAKAEFRRILAPHGYVALVWNDRRVDSPFASDYEAFLQTHSVDYAEVNHKRIDIEVIRAFFAPAPFERNSLPNAQTLDFEGLKGRVLSASYAPQPGHPKFAAMLPAMRQLFDDHQTAQRITIAYDTTVFVGRLG